MRTNWFVYGSWAVVLLAAIVVAALRGANSPEPQAQTGQDPKMPGGFPDRAFEADRTLEPAAFQQQTPPGRLPVVAENDPLAASKLEALRRIVGEEMPNASEDAKEIWAQQFRDLPEETVRFLLRQKVRSDNETADRSEQPDETVADSRPVVIPPPLAADGSVSRKAIRQASRVVIGNLLNVDTVGYRRQTVAFTGVSGALGADVAVAETRLDTRPGQLERGLQPFDLAINGSGFFPIEADGTLFYTRAGRFRLNAERRLVLVSAGREFVLVGIAAVPTATTEFLVAEDGRVIASLSGHKKELGRIRLASFLDPSRLGSIGGVVFEPSVGSGAAVADIDKPGLIVQGALEKSNVDREQEQRALANYRDRLERLDQ